MLYLVSDIHGNKQDFMNLLKKIRFNRENDRLIIMGDVVDRGPDGIELLYYIKSYLEDKSMELLMGNHELFLIMYLKGELSENKWSNFGGKETLNVVKTMSIDEKDKLLKFLEALPYYTEISSSFLGDTVVTHTGIDCDNYVINKNGQIDVIRSIDKAVERNKYNFMIGIDLHQIPESDKKKFNKFIIVGHFPCFRLNENNSNKFYRTPYYMDIDAGSGHRDQGGVLGCYCVTTDEEIYV